MKSLDTLALSLLFQGGYVSPALLRELTAADPVAAAAEHAPCRPLLATGACDPVAFAACCG